MIFHHISKNEFIKASLIVTFRKTSIRIIYGVLIVLFGLNLAMKLLRPDANTSIVSSAILLVVFPLVLMFIYGKGYNQNPDLQNDVELTFDDEKLYMKGETSKSEVQLNSIYKIIETKNWYILHFTKQLFYPIYKNRLDSNAINYLAELKNKVHKQLS